MNEETPDVPEFDFDAEFAKAFGPKTPVRSVIVAGITQPRALAALLPAHGVQAHVVPVKGLGAALVVHDPGTGEQDVQTLSAAVPQAEFVLLTVGEESIEGQSWTGGTRGEDPKPGLLLSVWPDLVQHLVLGKADPAEHAVSAEEPRKGAFWKRLRGRDDDPSPRPRLR
ncbi:hypothetical protein AB2L27_05050 [Kineococcus sp. LSe6-4]|uniref:Uncharacterized protein n=1 Tax=Kineococcus halophytocola TaxID=3234027 RepID=A0ABV4H0Y8_9ACTN